jgi:uncharacterized protein YeaO (DUF488 family)
MADAYTSNFARSSTHPRAVSIARWPPRWYGGARFLSLAPSARLLGQAKSGAIDWDEYTRRYRLEVLDALDPVETMRVLNELVGGPPVLLCWCAAGKPCHRHLTAEWLRLGGFEIEELEPSG